jgi:hypothetical protein
MRPLHLLTTLSLLSAVPTVLPGQDLLLAAWEFSNLSPAFAGNTIKANVSDLFVGDGEAIDGESGTMYADGSFGSTLIDNSETFSIGSFAPGSAFNFDVLTPTRPTANDLNVPVDGPSRRIFFTDGSFGGGGAADASRAYVVFRTAAPTGQVFTDTVFFSSAIGSQNIVNPVVDLSYSYDGATYTDAGSFTITQEDQVGPALTLTDAVGESEVFVRLRLPVFGFDQMLLDNVQFTGSIGDATTPASWWADSPADANGWRFSGVGYPGESGIGWIWDAAWPWIYTTGIADPSTGHWVYVYTPGGDRSAFYAWVAVDGGGYWTYALGGLGYYYSWESGQEGWKAFVW